MVPPGTALESAGGHPGECGCRRRKTINNLTEIKMLSTRAVAVIAPGLKQNKMTSLAGSEKVKPGVPSMR